MKLIRFVSAEEFGQYLEGKALRNTTHHMMSHRANTSVGFCFAEITEERDANKWLIKLFGCTHCSYALLFDTEECTGAFNESRAVYGGDTLATSAIPTLVREWCLTEYDRNRYPICDWGICTTDFKVLWASGPSQMTSKP